MSSPRVRYMHDRKVCSKVTKHNFLEGVPLLQYADDTTLFIEGLVEEARHLSTLLDLFTDFLGLQINRVKSAFVSFSLTHEEGL